MWEVRGRIEGDTRDRLRSALASLLVGRARAVLRDLAGNEDAAEIRAISARTDAELQRLLEAGYVLCPLGETAAR